MKFPIHAVGTPAHIASVAGNQCAVASTHGAAEQAMRESIAAYVADVVAGADPDVSLTVTGVVEINAALTSEYSAP
jgi:hypothetical protein